MFDLAKFKRNWKNYIILFLVLSIFLNLFFNSFLNLNYLDNSNNLKQIENSQIPINQKFKTLNSKTLNINSNKQIEIKSANLNLQTNHYGDSVFKIDSIIKKNSGIILNKNEYLDSKNNKNLNLKIKIESSKLDLVIKQLKEIGKIENLNINSNDVTKIFNDYSNRTNRYNKQIKKYYLMLNNRNLKIKDEISIQNRIDQLENQVFYLENQKEKLKEDSKYSKLNINLKENPSIFNQVNFLGFKYSFKLFLDSLNSSIQFIFKLLGFLIPFLIIFIFYKLSKKYIKYKK